MWLLCVLFYPGAGRGAMKEILLDFSKPEANEQMIEFVAVGHTGGGTKWKVQLDDEFH